MKSRFSKGSLVCLFVGLIAFLTMPEVANAAGWRLIGITGQQGNADPGPGPGGFQYPDNTLYEINHNNGSVSALFRATFVPDSHSIGYNPTDGLLYHTGGAEAYRDNPLQTGTPQGQAPVPGLAFQDNAFMEKINLSTHSLVGVFNANPCPNPDPTLPCWGLPAPIPSWSVPASSYRRDSTQTDPTNRVSGVDEYHAARGLAWSSSSNLFYLADEAGIFRMTADGDCKFLARPAFPSDGKVDESKGIAFVNVGGVTKLLVGHRNAGALMEINPADGSVVGEVALAYPPGGGEPVGEFGGVLGLVQHPGTHVLYGIRKTGENFSRELVTIDPVTGTTTLVGVMGQHFASIAFVPEDPWRLVGITGQQGNSDPGPGPGGFQYPDNTLYEINHNNGSVSALFRATFVPDSHSIGYNPTDGLLYHTGGAEAYRDNPLQTGTPQGQAPVPGLAFQDNAFMEKINLSTHSLVGVFNANPCPNPDPTLPCWGLPAPIPSWSVPASSYRRDSTQTDPTNRVSGVDEYHAARGLAWSSSSNLFYLADEAGIFRMTADGDCKFLARPAFPSDGKVDESKGIAFVNVGGVTKLLVGHRNAGALMEINPADGSVVGEVALAYPPGGGEPVGEFGGVLGLVQHPGTHVLYGIRKTGENFSRELVTIDPVTGTTTLVGVMGQHMASIAFVPSDCYSLVGITGQQGNSDPGPGPGGFQYPDNTLYEINHNNGSVSALFRATFVPDSHSIGYNPTDGLLYHTGGAEAYRDNPLQTGTPQGQAPVPGLAFQDNAFMEKINLTAHSLVGVFNANPCPNPDPTLPCWGLPAPIPSWSVPASSYRRDSTQTDPTNRVSGVDEYHAARGLAWSSSSNLFYLADEAGIFRMTADGDCKFLARPAFPSDGKVDESKGIAFVNVGGVTKLLVGHRNAGALMEINPADGSVVGEVALAYPPGGGEPVGEFGGVLGLVQHPGTHVLYGIRKTGENFSRELVTIDPVTGTTTLVGVMGQHFASIAFVGCPPLRIESITRNGNDLTITWTGGRAPYQLQRKSNLSPGSMWGNVGGTTTQLSAIIVNGAVGPQAYFQVLSH